MSRDNLLRIGSGLILFVILIVIAYCVNQQPATPLPPPTITPTEASFIPPSVTATWTIHPTITQTFTSTMTSTRTITATPTITPSPTPTSTVTEMPTNSPSVTPIVSNLPTTGKAKNSQDEWLLVIALMLIVSGITLFLINRVSKDNVTW